MVAQSISPDAITTSLEQLNVTNRLRSIALPPDSGTTSATASFPPSCALSLASNDTPETSDNDDNDASYGLPPPFTIRQTKSRGFALFTTRRIFPGTLIFAEEPLTRLSKHLESDYDAVEAAFKSLAKPGRKAYLALYDAEKSRMSKVVSTYYSNCYNTDSFSCDGGSCISALASRINHGCVPNATFSYVPPSAAMAKGQVRFHAIKSMSANKEIVACYEKNIFLTREQRQRRLMLDYGFQCNCEACVPKTRFWEKSDERRRAMAECVRIGKTLEKEWDEIKSRPGGDEMKKKRLCEKAIENVTKLEELLVKEGLVYTPLANAYRSLAKWSERMGDDDGASEWKRMELATCTICFGGDTVRSETLTQELREQLLANKDEGINVSG